MMKLSHEVYGDATERMKRALDAHYRIDTASGCWLWTASLDRDGYGRFGPRVTKLAHRASWMLHFGPIPDGMLVCHSCDVLHADPTLYRRCVNPGHLWLGTPADNGADMAAKIVAFNSDMAALPADLRKSEDRSSDHGWWDTPWLVLAATVLLGLDWALRRLARLP